MLKVTWTMDWISIFLYKNHIKDLNKQNKKQKTSPQIGLIIK